ncbi:MAG: RHS repeat-associated core domain-containing protein [Flavobacterium sp.]
MQLVLEKRLFDAWGSLIKVQDGAGNTLAGLTVLDRGYTGHEHLQSVSLINMNARLYDPMLHRFLGIDNYIQDPTNTQNFNNYGYVMNNPLSNTDISGNICEGCGGINVGPGENGTSTDLKQFGKDTGIDKWMGKNLNFNSWSRSFKKIFGGRHRGNSGPPPNVSKYVNLNKGNFSGGSSSTNSIPSTSNLQNNNDVMNWFSKESGPLWDVANDAVNTKGVVKIYTHGGSTGIVGPDTNWIKTAEDLNIVLMRGSPSWRNFRKNGGKLTLVLKACGTGANVNDGFAKLISKSFEGLNVIGPTKYFQAESFLWYSWDNGVKDGGTWNLYYNGELINRFKGK